SANATHIEPSPAPDFEGLLQRLAGKIPAHCILTRLEDRRPYECDGLSLYRSLPPLVILPENEAQVVEVVQACKAFNIPIVPRGAGTGLSGGAMPHSEGVLLGVSKLSRIL